jgi:hypothetical protein
MRMRAHILLPRVYGNADAFRRGADTPCKRRLNMNMKINRWFAIGLFFCRNPRKIPLCSAIIALLQFLWYCGKI